MSRIYVRWILEISAPRNHARVSRGPATMQDYLGWSSLTATHGKAGLEMVKDQLEHEVVDGRTYWFAEPSTDRGPVLDRWIGPPSITPSFLRAAGRALAARAREKQGHHRNADQKAVRPH